jgi:hypothetical protein
MSGACKGRWLRGRNRVFEVSGRREDDLSYHGASLLAPCISRCENGEAATLKESLLWSGFIKSP